LQRSADKRLVCTPETLASFSLIRPLYNKIIQDRPMRIFALKIVKEQSLVLNESD
jgi:hypothetical protein